MKNQLFIDSDTSVCSFGLDQQVFRDWMDLDDFSFGSGFGLDWIWTVFLRFGSGWFFFGLDLDFYRIGFLVFLVLDSLWS